METPLAIVCACLPTLPGYFKAWGHKLATRRSNADNGSKSSTLLKSLKSGKDSDGTVSKAGYQSLEGQAPAGRGITQERGV